MKNYSFFPFKMSMNFYWRKLTNGDNAMFNNINVGREDIPVCMEIYNPDDKTKPFKTFGVFRSAHLFLNYLADTEILKRCFYEVIRGSSSQKHYVDIDMKLDDDDFLNKYPHSKEEKLAISMMIVPMYVNILLSIKKEISPNDVLVFNSNSETKRSYHIIVDRWYFPSATQNRELFDQIIEKLPLQYHKYFDHSMYKNIQQFRTMLSTKCGVSRFKTLDKQSTWKIQGNFTTDAMKMRELFYASLVTEVTGNCRMLSFEYSERIAYVPSRYMDNNELDIVIKTFRNRFKDADDYDVQELKNSSIPLRRKRSNFCEICQKDHDSENPFLFVNFENKLFLNCRRNVKSQLICSLNVTDDGIIVNDPGDKSSFMYVPPKIAPRQQPIQIKPFVDQDFMDLTSNNQNDIKNKIYPHLESLKQTTKQEENIQEEIIPPVVKNFKVTQQEKSQHQKMIEDAKLRYCKPKPKGSVNARLQHVHHKIALM